MEQTDKPHDKQPDSQTWWAEGDLFEGCNCNLLCPCHVTFHQPPTNPYCEAIWGLTIERGRFGDTGLAGLSAVVFVHSPGPTMADGDWTAVLYIDDQANEEQFDALQSIFNGEAGGPWGRLAQFFRGGRYVEIGRKPLEITIDSRSRSLKVSEQLFLEVEAIRGGDREGLATITNLRNVVHGPEHVMARSTQNVTGGGLNWVAEGKHGLYSRFHWQG